MNSYVENIPDILKEFGMELSAGRETFFRPFVTETSSEGKLLECTLYFLAMEISYEYRAVNVEIQPKNWKVRFFTLKTPQSLHYDVPNNGEQSLSLLKLQLHQIGELGVFKSALEFLVNQTELKREYANSSIRNQIVIGHARVAVLRDGSRINVGWKRFEGADEVVFYTGQGLYNIWRPNMTEEEQRKANELQNKSEEELKTLGYLDRRKISDFVRIE